MNGTNSRYRTLVADEQPACDSYSKGKNLLLIDKKTHFIK